MASAPFNYFSNIFIHDNPVAYRREVARYLDLIRTTESGRTLIKFIKMRHATAHQAVPSDPRPRSTRPPFDIPRPLSEGAPRCSPQGRIIGACGRRSQGY